MTASRRPPSFSCPLPPTEAPAELMSPLAIPRKEGDSESVHSQPVLPTPQLGAEECGAGHRAPPMAEEAQQSAAVLPFADDLLEDSAQDTDSAVEEKNTILSLCREPSSSRSEASPGTVPRTEPAPAAATQCAIQLLAACGHPAPPQAPALPQHRQWQQQQQQQQEQQLLLSLPVAIPVAPAAPRPPQSPPVSSCQVTPGSCRTPARQPAVPQAWSLTSTQGTPSIASVTDSCSTRVTTAAASEHSPLALGATPPVAVSSFDSEESLLASLVQDTLTHPAHNPYSGSLALATVQCHVLALAPGLYDSVIGTRYGRSFHRFIQSHSQFRIFHYGADVVQQWRLTHCSADGARLAFSATPNVALALADRQTAFWRAQLLEDALCIIERIVRAKPMHMRALMHQFEQADTEGRYSGVLPSNHAFRKLIRDNPGRVQITPNTLLKVPEQLTAEERGCMPQRSAAPPERWLSQQ